MRKHGGTPSRRDKHVTLAAISPPCVARGGFVEHEQTGLAGCKLPPLFTRGASSCSSRGRRQGEPWGASPRPSAPTYPTYLGSFRVLPVRGPAMGFSLAGPSGVGLGLRALRWLACVDPVADVSCFPYSPSFDEGHRRRTHHRLDTNADA